MNTKYEYIRFGENETRNKKVSKIYSPVICLYNSSQFPCY